MTDGRNNRNPMGFPTFRVTDGAEELVPNLAAADRAHARALVTAMYGGDVASRARIESTTQEGA